MTPLNAAGGLLEVALPEGGTTRLPALPLQFGDQRPGLRIPVPRAGADADEVLADMGLDAEQVARLRARGIIR